MHKDIKIANAGSRVLRYSYSYCRHGAMLRKETEKRLLIWIFPRSLMTAVGFCISQDSFKLQIT